MCKGTIGWALWSWAESYKYSLLVSLSFLTTMLLREEQCMNCKTKKKQPTSLSHSLLTQGLWPLISCALYHISEAAYQHVMPRTKLRDLPEVILGTKQRREPRGLGPVSAVPWNECAQLFPRAAEDLKFHTFLLYVFHIIPLLAGGFQGLVRAMYLSQRHLLLAQHSLNSPSMLPPGNGKSHSTEGMAQLGNQPPCCVHPGAEQ